MFEVGDQVVYRSSRKENAPPGERNCTFIIKCKHINSGLNKYYLHDHEGNPDGEPCDEHRTRWVASDRDLELIVRSVKSPQITNNIVVRKFNGNIIKL